MRAKKKHIKRYIMPFLAAVLAIAATVFVYFHYVTPILQERRINNLILQAERQPSQQLTDTLTSLLDNRIATPAQGERILTAICALEVQTRSSYCIGKPVCFAYKFKCPMRSNAAVDNCSIRISFNNRKLATAPGRYLLGNRRFKELPVTSTEPADCTAYIDLSCSVTPRHRETTWHWKPNASSPRSLLPYRQTRVWQDPNDRPFYLCNIRTPVHCNVVEEAEAEKVALVSNTELDQNMREMLSKLTVDGRWSIDYGPTTERRSCTGRFIIACENLPTNIAFKAFFRDNSGHEYSLVHHNLASLRALEHTSGTIWLDPAAFNIHQIGTIRGTLILRPDPELAYFDPQIKAIWGQTLELPVTIHVTAKN